METSPGPLLARHAQLGGWGGAEGGWGAAYKSKTGEQGWSRGWDRWASDSMGLRPVAKS